MNIFVTDDIVRVLLIVLGAPPLPTFYLCNWAHICLLLALPAKHISQLIQRLQLLFSWQSSPVYRNYWRAISSMFHFAQHLTVATTDALSLSQDLIVLFSKHPSFFCGWQLQNSRMTFLPTLSQSTLTLLLLFARHHYQHQAHHSKRIDDILLYSSILYVNLTERLEITSRYVFSFPISKPSSSSANFGIFLIGGQFARFSYYTTSYECWSSISTI